MKKCIENYKPSCVHKYIDWTEDAIYGGQCKKEWSLKWLTHLLPERRVHEYVEVQIKFWCPDFASKHRPVLVKEEKEKKNSVMYINYAASYL